LRHKEQHLLYLSVCLSIYLSVYPSMFLRTDFAIIISFYTDFQIQSQASVHRKTSIYYEFLFSTWPNWILRWNNSCRQKKGKIEAEQETGFVVVFSLPEKTSFIFC